MSGIFLEILLLPPDPSPTCNSASVGNLPSSGQTAEPESETFSPTSPPSGHGCSQTNITLNLETCSYFLSSPSTPTPTPHEISPWWTVDNLQFEF